MTPIERLLAELKVDEGFRGRVYKDAVDKLTFGYGHNLEDNDISERLAALLLWEDLSKTLEELEKMPFFDSLSEARRGALANMHFNLGNTRFMGFKKMLKCIQESDYKGAAREMLDSKWASQVGDRAKRLAQQMESDEWQ